MDNDKELEKLRKQNRILSEKLAAKTAALEASEMRVKITKNNALILAREKHEIIEQHKSDMEVQRVSYESKIAELNSILEKSKWEERKSQNELFEAHVFMQEKEEEKEKEEEEKILMQEELLATKQVLKTTSESLQVCKKKKNDLKETVAYHQAEEKKAKLEKQKVEKQLQEVRAKRTEYRKESAKKDNLIAKMEEERKRPAISDVRKDYKDLSRKWKKTRLEEGYEHICGIAGTSKDEYLHDFFNFASKSDDNNFSNCLTAEEGFGVVHELNLSKGAQEKKRISIYFLLFQEE